MRCRSHKLTIISRKVEFVLMQCVYREPIYLASNVSVTRNNNILIPEYSVSIPTTLVKTGVNDYQYGEHAVVT